MNIPYVWNSLPLDVVSASSLTSFMSNDWVTQKVKPMKVLPYTQNKNQKEG